MFTFSVKDVDIFYHEKVFTVRLLPKNESVTTLYRIGTISPYFEDATLCRLGSGS